MPYLHSDGYTLPLPSPWGQIYPDGDDEAVEARIVLLQDKLYVEHDLDYPYYGTFYVEAPGSYADLEFEIDEDRVMYAGVVYTIEEAKEKFATVTVQTDEDRVTRAETSSDPVNAKATQLLRELGLR